MTTKTKIQDMINCILGMAMLFAIPVAGANLLLPTHLESVPNLPNMAPEAAYLDAHDKAQAN